MDKRFIFVLISILACTFFLTACSTTKLTGKWQDEGYSKTSSKILILGMTNNRAVRQIFEAKLSKALKEHGISAYPGFTEFDYDQTLEKDSIVDYVKKNGIDSVLVTKVLDSETYRQLITEHSGGVMGHASSGYGGSWYTDYYSSQTSTYESEFSVYNLETNLYVVGSEKKVWSVFTRMETLDRTPDTIDDLVDLLVKQLKEDRLI